MNYYDQIVIFIALLFTLSALFCSIACHSFAKKVIIIRNEKKVKLDVLPTYEDSILKPPDYSPSEYYV